ncbi:amino acid adenylation domain-containing protein [Rhodospirillum sp. A1_3_36]|uniref:amino acid adenylation domain-containing protein n=1 Tax=Rhodospirillum sp. A1_3_36 TaxID=3391666 RepID=UPI0039A4106F
MSVQTLIDRLSVAGIRLHVEDGKLGFRAPKGALTDERRAEISGCREELIHHLQSDLGQSAPLSHAQRRLWLIEQSVSVGAAYCIIGGARIDGPLDVSRLEEALNAVMRRHESLRTHFTLQDDTPRQIVAEGLSVPFTVTDASDAPDPDSAGKALLTETLARPFDLTRPPLLRAHLVKLSPTRHLLGLCLHHIIADGWSISVFLKDLGAAYEGQDIEAIAAPSYRDYVRAQQREFPGTALEDLKANWRDRLAGCPDLLELPADRRRPPDRDQRGQTVTTRVSAKPIRQLAKTLGASPFMVALAGFYVLLNRYSNEADLLVGVALSGREDPAYEDLIGLLVNTLPMRADLSDAPSVRELISRVHQESVEVLRDGAMPFDLVVQAINPLRDPRWHPIYQTAFAYQNVRRETLSLGSAELEPVPLDTGYSRVDLGCAVEEQDDELQISFEYTTDLFDAWRMRQMVRHYGNILTTLAEDPECPIDQIPFLDADDLRSLNALTGGADVGAPEVNTTLLEAIQHWAAVDPTRPALAATDDAGASLNYGELDRQSNRLARHLITAGVTPGSIVGLYCHRSVPFLVGIVAILKSGAAYLPLDPSVPEARRDFIIDNADVSALMTLGQYESDLRETGRPLVLLEGAEGPDDAGAEPIQIECGPDDLAYVLYTSGSTGAPKGVCVTHRNVVSFCLAISRFGEFERRTMLHTASILFDAATFEIWLPLTRGGQIMVAPTGPLGSLDIAKILTEHDIHHVFLTTGLLNRMIDEAPEALASLETIWSGGEVASPVHLRRLVAHMDKGTFFNAYGPTETTVMVTLQPLTAGDEVPDPIPIGKVMSNVRAHVVDRHLNRMPFGVPGELVIGGDCVSRGYLNAPEKTAKGYLDSVPHLGEGRVYRTGDKVCWRSDGTLDFVGRIDNQIKLRGFRIEPQEIESHLLSDPAISQAVIKVFGDGQRAQKLVAYLVPREGEELNVRQIRQTLAKRVPNYMVPAAFVRLDTLPTKHNGKVDLNALPEPGAVERKTPPVGPTNPVEETLCRVWSELLSVKQVSIHDNFFELGGDSILSMQVAMRAARAGIGLTMRQLLKYQTVAEQAAAAETTLPSTQASPTQPVLDLPLTPMQSWFFSRDLLEPAHWNQSVRLAVRHRVSVEVLSEVLNKLVGRHDALRLQFRAKDGEWIADIRAATEVNVPVTCHGPDGFEQGCRAAQAAHDFNAAPLLRAVLCQSPEGNVTQLFLTAHHLVVDAVSWRVIVEDLSALLAGKDLPPSPSWAHWVRSTEKRMHDPALMQAVRGLIARVERGQSAGPPWCGRQDDEALVTVTLSQELTKRLLTHTKGPKQLLPAAIAGAAVDWVGSSSFVIEVETHGRDLLSDQDASRMVGWFTILTPILIDWREDQDSLAAMADTLARIELGLEVPDAHARLTSFGPKHLRTPLSALPTGEIAINYIGVLDTAVSDDGPFQPMDTPSELDKAASNLRTHRLEVVGAVDGGQLQIAFRFNAGQDTAEEIEALAARVERVLDQTLRQDLPPPLPRWVAQAGADPDLVQRICESLRCKTEDITQILPLARQQQGMLLDALAGPSSEANVEQSRLVLCCPFDPDALGRAWRIIAERHPILRSGFVWQGLSRPVQAVLKAEIARPEVHVVKTHPNPEHWLRDLRAKGIDFTKAPLINLAMIRAEQADDSFACVRARGTWVLALTFHHSLLDGWSLPVLVAELMAAYRAEITQDRSIAFPPVRPYSDYVAWQEGQDEAAAERVWRKNLADFPGPALPGIETPDTLGGSGYGDAHAELGADALAKLTAAARSQSLSMNMVVQGALAIVLSAIGGGRDVVFGATTSGRPTGLSGSNAMIGLFSGSVPVRIKLAAGQAFWPLLSALQEESAQGCEVDYLGAGRIHNCTDLSAAIPLFEILLVYENFPTGQDDSTEPDWQIQDYTAVGSRTRYPVALLVMPGETLRFHLIHQRHRVPDAVAHKLLGLLTTCLDHIANGETDIDSLLRTAHPPEPLAIPKAPWRESPGKTGRAPTTPTELRLANIWAEVLGLESLSAEANFFELGGHSLKAMDLAARLSKVMGRDFPISLLFARPTLAELAAAVDQGLVRPLPVLPLANEDASHPPVFLFPGASDTPHAYGDLARDLGGNQPVHGLHYKALRDIENIEPTVEALAARAVVEMRRLQPVGGLRLVGHSFGGAVVLAVAALEEEAGRSVDLAVVLDLPPPPIDPTLLPANDEAGLIAEIVEAAALFFNRPIPLTAADLSGLDRPERLTRFTQALVHSGLLPDGIGSAAVETVLENYRFCISALKDFHPKPLATRLHVVAAETSSFEVPGAEGWSSITSGGAERHQVVGDHITMITAPHVATLATVLRKLLTSID